MQQLTEDAFMIDAGYEVAAGGQVGGFEGQGGMWLCWCKAKYEESWAWKWCGLNDVETVMYEDVRELLESFWGEWRGIKCVYGDLGYESIA